MGECNQNQILQILKKRREREREQGQIPSPWRLRK